MIKPVRLRLSRARGFDLQALSRATNGLPAVNCARPTKWGNPFNFRRSEYCWAALSFGCRGDAKGRQEASVRAFREWIDPPYGRRTLLFEKQPEMVSRAQSGTAKSIALGPKIVAGEAPSKDEIIEALRGKNLGCWCNLPKPGEPDVCHAAVLLDLANRPTCEETAP